jgi:hypothetical protein
MKKLKLNLEALRVDSFQTAAGAREARGTVRGHAVTVEGQYGEIIIQPIVSTDDPFGCLNSVGWTCGVGC